MPTPYPREFHDDVVRVARNREPGVHLRQIAADFGISESCLANWLKAADVEDGLKPGTTRRRTRSCARPGSGSGRWSRLGIPRRGGGEEVLRRAPAYLSQANLLGKGSTLPRALSRGCPK